MGGGRAFITAQLNLRRRAATAPPTLARYATATTATAPPKGAALIRDTVDLSTSNFAAAFLTLIPPASASRMRRSSSGAKGAGRGVCPHPWPLKPGARDRWLLRPRRERPRRCAAQQRDEVASFQMVELHRLIS
jgi:hypothetical protein